MAYAKDEKLVHGIKLSSVGPGRVSGSDVVHEPSSMDLAMKLHYLRGVYYFKSEAVEGLTVSKIKESMFSWLNYYYMTNGRFRRSESGRPFIKCNDCGTRLIEAQCSKTMDEWLEMMNDYHSLHNLLVSNDVIGPELAFSPLVLIQAYPKPPVTAALAFSPMDEWLEMMHDYHSLHNLLVSNDVIGSELAFSPLVLIQFTWFKCGGVSVGLSWAHVLGDALSASYFINMWGQVLAGHEPNPVPNMNKLQKSIQKSENPEPLAKEPLPIKRVNPVGDHWIVTNNCKMATFSFQITGKQLTHLQSKVCGQNHTVEVPSFECLCAIIWKCVAKISEASEPKIVTICKNNPCDKKNKILSNSQIISMVKADLSIMEAKPKELAALLMNQTLDRQTQIEDAVERDHGLSDFIVYGSNLTFVDMEDANFYGLELKGQKPIFVNYTIDGVGENGLVLVLQGPKNSCKEGGEGRIVTVIVPENQALELESELKRECFL